MRFAPVGLMDPKGPIGRDCSAEALLSDHRGRCGRALVALVLACALWIPSARAEGAKRQSVDAPSALAPGVARPKVEILAHGFYGNKSIGMLGVGLEGVYLPSAHFGVGAALDGFYVDNFEYPDPGTLDRGVQGSLLAEGYLFSGWLTPYARVAVGLGGHQRYESSPWLTKTQLAFVGQLSGGLAVRGGPVVGKLSVSPSLFGKDFVMTYGVALGMRI